MKNIGSENLALQHTEPRAPVGKVVHLVDPVTDDVYGFLGPATAALAEAEIEQSIVFVNRPQLHHVLPQVNSSFRVILTPEARNPLRRWIWALKAFRKELRQSPTQGVHLYGRLPTLIGTWVARRAGVTVAWHYPSGGAGSSPAALAHPGASEFKAPSPDSLALMERPVSPQFFSVPRVESRRPLVVTGSHFADPRSADLFAQLAVLLGGEDLGLAFNWLGTVDEPTRLRLKAAQVGVFRVDTAGERASRLSSGWVYLAPGGDRGFPSHLVEAMAVGLPCVAVDTPDHREIIRHGEDGYLCRTPEEIVSCIAPLIDSPELRLRIGLAARQSVEQRFGEARFRDALLSAYQLPLDAARSP